MIATERLVAWAHAEGLTAEETTLREAEQAAVDYVNRMTGRNYGASAEIVETFRWRGGVLDLANEPVDLVLEQWTGSAWEAIGADSYTVDGRLVYLEGAYAVGGTRVRATYTAGYEPGDPEADPPGDPDVWDAPPVVQQAVRLLTMHWFVNREAVVTGTISTELQLAVDSLLRAAA